MINIFLKHFQKIVFILFLQFTLPLMAQQVKVVAPQVVSVDGYFELRYVVENADVDGIELPELSGFVILSGPNQSQSQSYSFVNGKSSHTSSITYTYILQPKEKGEYIIPEALLIVDGKEVKAKSVKIQVSGESSQQSSRNQSSRRQRQVVTAKEVTEDDLFVKVKASKTNVSEQEAVVLTYSIYSKMGVGLSHVALAKTPDFKNLVSHDLETSEADVRVEEIKGETFKVTDCLKYVVFPQTSGEIIVDPLIFECQVVHKNPAMDFIDAFFNGNMVSKVIKCATKPLKLNVAALPEPKPFDYSGGVGELDLTCELVSKKLRANEMGHIRVEVSGYGNMKLLLPPTIEFPADFDTYEVKITEELQLSGKGHSGKVIYDYTFVPFNVGNYNLQPIEISYYDTKTKSYQTLTADIPTLEVKQGVRSATDVERSKALREADIRTIHQGSVVLYDAANIMKWGTWGYWLTNVGLFVLVGLLIVLYKQYVKKHSDISSRLRKRAGKAAAKRLKNVKAVLDGRLKTDFYQELQSALHSYIIEKYGLSKAELNKENIKLKLESAGVDEENVSLFVQILEECEFARFAPSATSDKQQRMYEQACTVINNIER